MVIALNRSNALVSSERPADKRAFAILPGPIGQGNRICRCSGAWQDGAR